jgi:DNA-binding NtrC family response regulator
MAKVALIGLGRAAAGQICSALAKDNHQIIRYQEQEAIIRELLDVDFVFAGGEPPEYLPLLKRVRDFRPMMPFVVVARVPETIEWLDALEAGATDYCSTPIDTRQLHWMMERAQARPRFARTVSHPAQGI